VQTPRGAAVPLGVCQTTSAQEELQYAPRRRVASQRLRRDRHSVICYSTVARHYVAVPGLRGGSTSRRQGGAARGDRSPSRRRAGPRPRRPRHAGARAPAAVCASPVTAQQTRSRDLRARSCTGQSSRRRSARRAFELGCHACAAPCARSRARVERGPCTPSADPVGTRPGLELRARGVTSLRNDVVFGRAVRG
jgi:hypothetical protein